MEPPPSAYTSSSVHSVKFEGAAIFLAGAGGGLIMEIS